MRTATARSGTFPGKGAVSTLPTDVARTTEPASTATVVLPVTATAATTAGAAAATAAARNVGFITDTARVHPVCTTTAATVATGGSPASR